MDKTENERLLIALEVGLLDPTVRRSATQLADLLAPDFVEFGSSGEVYTKEEMIAQLLRETDGGSSVERTGEDFVVRWLGNGSALLTYRASRNDQDGQTTSLRASIWRHFNARWQLIFHQGTIIS